MEAGCRRDDLVEVSGILAHRRELVFQFLGGFEVVGREDDAYPIAQFRDLGHLHRLGALKFEIHQLKAGISGFGKDVDLCGDRSLEFAAVYRPTAGRDHGRLGMDIQKMLQLGKGCRWLRQVV